MSVVDAVIINIKINNYPFNKHRMVSLYTISLYTTKKKSEEIAKMLVRISNRLRTYCAAIR